MNSSKSVEVWDVLIRFLHWLMVIAVFGALMTTEENNAWHRYAGFALLLLTMGRILWGFFGEGHAQFASFVCSGTEVAEYLKGCIKGRPRRYLGSNPLAGWLVVMLLLSALVVWFSGYKYYTVKYGIGNVVASSAIPEVEQTIVVEPDLAEEEYWQSFHQIAVYCLLGLIALHMSLVIFLAWVHKENLFKSMLTGKKALR